MWRRLSIHSWPGRSSRLPALSFGLLLFLLITPMLMSQEQQSENPSLQKSRSIANDLLTTSVTLSTVIDSWLDNSRTQEQRLTRSLAEQRRLSKALDEASNTVNEQQSLLLDSWRASESSSKSLARYVETTEKQFKEVAEERDKEATRARRRGVAFLVAAGIAVLEGAILIAQ